MSKWDAKYAAKSDAPFGDNPNEYLLEIQARSDFEIGSALCLADGDGRNGTWLARQGIAVTAVDLSPVGTERALRRDAEAGVEVEREVADLADWTPQAGRQWDAVLLFYLHCEEDTRARALRLAASVLPLGGWFVMEAFAKGQAADGEMGPDDPDLLYSLAELRDVFSDFVVVEALSGHIGLNEGERHCGEGEIVRFAARRSS